MAKNKKNTPMPNPKNRMPQATKDAWVAGLRSGEYTQGKYSMKTPDGCYCCLGVLEMVVDGKVEINKDVLRADIVPSYDWLEKNGIEFKDISGDVSRDPYFYTTLFKQFTTLSTINDLSGDNYDATPADNGFNAIADIIESIIEGY